MDVDFVIVAALKDEANEIKGLLIDAKPEDTYVVGKVKRWKDRGEYRIAIINLHEGMGAQHAGPVTQQAIAELHPRAVLMTGIAAGFLESREKVALGDLMVPFGIVPYELAKLEGAKEGRSARTDHRGIAWAVSEMLWRTAANVAEDPERPWQALITAARPDGLGEPRIHAVADSVLGCGEKVVADELADVRKWLLETYPRQILGLEMESHPALGACRIYDTPFLVAKASADRATVDKDDGWRSYACQLSAGFLLTVIQRYERPQAALLLRHTRDCEEIAKTIRERLPDVDFQYKIRTAVSFEQLRRGTYEAGERDRTTLVPGELHPNVVLYSGGGTGKTTITKRLFCDVLAADCIPVLIDLKRYSQEYPDGEAPAAGQEGIDAILQVATSPRRSASEIEALAAQGRLVLLVDGVNEVSKVALASLLAFYQDLRRGPGTYAIWMNRLTAIEDLRPAPVHATVGSVSPEVAERCFDDRFGQGRFKSLSGRLQTIYQRPFFLDLAIRSNRPFTANRLWSEMFHEFFREHVGLSEVQLTAIALATRDAIAADGKLKLSTLKQAIGDPLWAKLSAAGVGVVDDEAGFAHHLWRDYLVARAMSVDPACWTEKAFDAATTFGTSVECLTMAVEQIADVVQKIAFVNAVYDWSYSAALECIAKSGEGEEAERKLPEWFREAILAVVAEKRFDSVERTRSRTERLLTQYPFTRPYLDAPSRDAMVDRIRNLEGDADELGIWKRLYSQAQGTGIAAPDIELIASPNSLLGWTAANLARRGSITAAEVDRVCSIYRDHLGPDGKRSVRWRAVHVLGANPNTSGLAVLEEALEQDEYHWVAYGAARSLVESAAKLTGDDGARALDALSRFVAGERGGKARSMILQEIVETCFIDDSAPGWAASAALLIDQIAERFAPEVRRGVVARSSAFREKNGMDGHAAAAPSIEQTRPVSTPVVNPANPRSA
ncbi:hypothetical protein P12x_005229 [Tundrisphaera lichenicola]|uniref:phosphorylase family protein n=1 Tax=Tundrisphaera lichenicola TaxID=2029860 RepID=UPI003EB8CB20